MVRETPFTYSFSIANGTTKKMTFSLGSCRAVLSLTIHIEDETAGPILVNASIVSGKLVYQLGNPTEIYDGESINAKRFNWQGLLPTDRALVNKLVIEAANYTSGDIKSVRFTGVKRR